jgi:hypothetical protein
MPFRGFLQERAMAKKGGKLGRVAAQPGHVPITRV